MYIECVHEQEDDVKRVSVAQARRDLRRLLDEVSAGREVAVLRRGTEVARLVPARGRGRRLPSLAAFRRTISVRGEALSTAVIKSRREARY